MTPAAYKKSLQHPLRQRTSTFLLKDNSVLLGFKKSGFGKGYLLGIGGKKEEGETIEDAAKRELKEEIATGVSHLEMRGTLNFYFPHVTDESWNQQVIVFITNSWTGEPTESSEIRPEWFETGKIPYALMWDDAKYWLPLILDGKKVFGEFLFDDTLHVQEKVLIVEKAKV